MTQHGSASHQGTHRDGTFTGASGRTAYWQAWVPDEARALVVLVHGLAEHSGRYVDLAARLNSAGYVVYAVDHHGHGRSAGTRGNLGRLAWLVEDVETVRRQAQADHPGLPVFLLGHSLGGLVTATYLVEKGEGGLAGAVFSGAAVDPAVGSALERRLAGLLSRVAPNLQVVELGIDNISRDPAVVDAYRRDPLVYTGRVRARTGAETLAAIERTVTRLSAITLPVLFLHGSEDRLATPAGSELLHDSVSSRDKTHRVYRGLYHEIFNEPERDQVLDDLVGWLDEHR